VIDIGDGGVEAFVGNGEGLAVQAEGLVAEVVVRGTGEMAKVALEAEIRGLYAEMPFARHRREVASRCEHFGDCHRPFEALIARLTAPTTTHEADAG
jgi:hypothetical protein